MSATLALLDARILSFDRLSNKYPDMGWEHVADDLRAVRKEHARLIEQGDRLQLFLPFAAGQLTVNDERHSQAGAAS